MNRWIASLALLLFATPLLAQNSVPLTVQTGTGVWAAQTVSGERTNAPVTFGVGIPDSWNIDCPSTGASLPVQNQAAPTKLILKYSGTQVSSQYRCMGHWPSGNAEWVLVDAQLPCYNEVGTTTCAANSSTPGYDVNLSLVTVSSGGGNITCTPTCSASTPMAVDSSPGNPNTGTITVTTGAATFVIQKANFDLFHSITLTNGCSTDCTLVSSGGHGTNDGLTLLGPTHTAIVAGGIASTQCGPGPIPTNATVATCATPYGSIYDANSTAIIEENGGLKSVVMINFNFVSSTNSTDIYMHGRVRMTFWANRSDVKVTVGMRNADVPAGCCGTPNFTNAYKEFNQFEERLTENFGGSSSRGWGFANGVTNGAAVTSGTGLLTTQSAYLWQGHSGYGSEPDWDAGSGDNCTTEADSCVQSYVPRSGAYTGNCPGATCGRAYSLAGGQIALNGVGQAQWTDVVTASTGVPTGWGDIDDGTNGIEIGVHQLAMYWPKSLEFQPGTVSGHTEIRVGIWPNQQEWLTTGSPYQINPSYTTSGTCPGVTCYSQPQVSYAMGWPQYSVHDTYWNFHAGTLSASSYAAAQQDFLDFQHYLLARPQSGTYYNSVVDATYSIPALFYKIPDPVAEDTYWTGVSSSICGTSFGRCLADIGNPGAPYYSGCSSTPYQNYCGMKIFRFFIWQNAGGSNGTQFEQRFSFDRNWLQRGGAGIAGSQPGRFLWAGNFYRMVVEKTLPRSDTATTSGNGAGFRSLMANLGCTPTNTTACDNLEFFPWGDPKNNTLPSVWNGGMRNWGDASDSMEHSDYWGIFTHYFLTGDEWLKEQALQGFKDRHENPYIPFNNLAGGAGSGFNDSPGHGHINDPRAVGHWAAAVANFADFLRAISDPDADTTSTALTSPGACIPNGGSCTTNPTALQAVEQTIATEIALPFIRGAYPAGWADKDTGCLTVTSPFNRCSMGVDPLGGFVRAGEGAEICGTGSGSSPCNNTNQRADDSFQLGVWTDGVYQLWEEMLKVLGPGWHIPIGTTSGGLAPVNGATSTASLASNPGNVTISEKNLLDAIAGAAQQMVYNNCVDVGSYSGSGCVYDQFSDYLNTTPPCTSNGNCSRVCSSGCGGATMWTAVAGSAMTTNSTYDLNGVLWQRIFESQAINNGNLSQEFDSHMMNFGESVILAAGSLSPSYTVSAAQPTLQPVPGGFTLASGSNCTANSTYIVGGSSAGTCTITWTAPPSLTIVGGVSYRLKYLPCQTGVLTIYGNDCPSGGKAIVPSLVFHTDSTTAGTQLFQNLNGSTPIGSTLKNPANFWPWHSTSEVPDGGSNTAAVTGTSYTFHTAPNTTYTFALYAFQTSAATLAPTSQAFFSAAVGTSSGDSAHTIVLTAGASNLTSVSIPTVTNFPFTTTCGSTLTAGTSCNIVISFTPTTTGNLTGTLTVNFAGGSITASLSGTGLAAGNVCIIPPIVGAACDALYTYNSQTVGLASSDSPAQETLSNTSGTGLTGIACSTTGTNAGDFTIGGSCATTLANDATYNVPTTFTPGAAGSRTGNLSVSYGGGSGPVLTAATCNESDVAAEVALVAADNTTINVPSGTCTWTTPLATSLTYSTSIIFGNGGTTTLNDAVPNSSGSMFSIQIPVGKTFRLSGATIQPLSTNPANYLADMVSVLGTCNSGGCPNFRLDHNIFTGSTGSSWASGSGWQFDVADVFGVADHNTVTYPSGGGIFGNVSHASYLGVGQYGDNSWTQPDSLGTGNAFYFEDNTVQALGTAPQPALIVDCDHSAFGAQHVGACRIVIRYNTLINAGGTVHGTESGGRSRGGRQIEIYDNAFTCNSTNGCSNGFQARSGVVYQYGNTYTTGAGSWFNGFLQLAEFRRWANLGGWGACNGNGAWDNNDGVVYATGTITATSGSGGASTLVVTDSTKSWAANAWAPGNGSSYSIVDTAVGAAYGWEISSSTSNSVSSTLYSQDSYNSYPVFHVGDTYQILKASVCIDQPSRSLSTLLSGATPPTGWVNEVLDPSYEWNDSLSGTITFSLMGSQTLSLIANRDWYQESSVSQTANTSTTSPFNGTSGTGWGTLANRPTSCIPHVAYSTIGFSSDNSLYFCNSTNTWSTSLSTPASYTSFTYPHPLVSSGGGGTAVAPLAGTGIGASVTLAPATYTFATTVLGISSSDSPETFTLTNSTSSAVTAISISLIGADPSDYSDAIPATTCGTSLAIGASCQIFVSFAPVATGVRTATLSISDSDSSSPQSSSLFGTAIPPVINPTPANPITFGVAITDPSIPSTVKNENQKRYESFASSRARNRGIATKQSLLEGCPLVENHAGAGAANATGAPAAGTTADCAARDSSEINSAYNFSHIDLFGFLHQERLGYAAGAAAR
jgi:hypothetical protein